MGDDIDRRKTYSTIKDSVFDTIHQTKGEIDLETMTKYVLENFPNSKWDTKHWSWYKSQIKTGRFKNDFSDEEKKNLQLKKTEKISPNILPTEKMEKPAGNHIKRIGDNILNHIRMMTREITRNDEDFEFKLNRWVYSHAETI